MSRVGKAAITLPDKVEVKLENAVVTVKGPKGELNQPIAREIGMEQEDGSIQFTRPNNQARNRAQHGLARALVAGMVEGVTNGHRKTLTLHGVGFRAQLQGKDLLLNVGYSHPVVVKAPEGITFTVEPGEKNQPLKIHVDGIDKALVGQLAADVRKVRKPDPYKGKGLRYIDEQVKLRPGKRAGA